MKWLTKAAKQGNAKAQLALCDLYIGGGGIPKDTKKMKEWLIKAATNKNQANYFYDAEDAKLIIGQFYYDGGGGFPKDYKQALEWFAKEAKQGNKDAIEYLKKHSSN